MRHWSGHAIGRSTKRNNALPFALIAWGQTHLPAGLASILNAATPLFSVLVAHVFTAEEKLSRFKIIGTAAGLAGVAWVVGPDLLWGRGASNACAEGAVLLAALSYAASAVFARRIGVLGCRCGNSRSFDREALPRLPYLRARDRHLMAETPPSGGSGSRQARRARSGYTGPAPIPNPLQTTANEAYCYGL